MFHRGNKYIGIHVSVHVLMPSEASKSYAPLLLSEANDCFHYIRDGGDICTAKTFEILDLKTT